jgi:hypothetical protein
MPITGGGPLLGDARLAAEDAVRASWLAKGRELSAAELEQMRREMKEADSAAIITFLTANALVPVTVAVTGGTGVGNGVIT